MKKLAKKLIAMALLLTIIFTVSFGTAQSAEAATYQHRDYTLSGGTATSFKVKANALRTAELTVYNRSSNTICVCYKYIWYDIPAGQAKVFKINGTMAITLQKSATSRTHYSAVCTGIKNGSYV